MYHHNVTIISPLNVHSTTMFILYMYICLQLFACFFLTHYAMCLPQIRVVYIRIYITIISICSHYTILTTSLVKPGVGKSPDLGILNVTFKYMLDMISRTVGWLASGTMANPIQPLPHHDSCWFQKHRKQKNCQRNPVNPNVSWMKHVTCYQATLSADVASRQHRQTPWPQCCGCVLDTTSAGITDKKWDSNQQQ
jgi:hypothetical protein